MRRRPIFVLIVGAVLFTCALPAIAQNVITSVAGTNWTFPPGVTVAANAPLAGVTGLAVDPQGNLYVADPDNHRIFRVSPDGGIRIVAGNGTAGFSGDGGQATAASLSAPQGVALDDSGNIFIADSNNQRIRKVTASGIITTVAGKGSFDFSGDGGPATAANLGQPTRVVVEASGNLYIADADNHRVRKVSADGVITTFAGNGISGFSGDGGPAASASLNRPAGMAVDIQGNLLIADSNNNRIRKVTAGGTITTVVGNGTFAVAGDGGPAISASISQPQGVAVDSAGNLYLANTSEFRIRKVTAASGIITTIVNTGGGQGFSGDGGQAALAELSGPRDVAVDSAGNLFVADTLNYRVRKVTAAGGIINTFAGNGNFNFAGDGGPASAASLNSPAGLAVDAAGNLFIADTNNGRIRKRTTAGVITTVAGNANARFVADGGPAISTPLYYPNSVAVDAAGNLLIADTTNGRVRRVSTNGIITTVAGTGSATFSGDGGPATQAGLGAPAGIVFDAFGSLYISDVIGHRIRKVSATGTITTVAGNGIAGFSGDGGPAISASLNRPVGITVDGSGNLYIADTENHRIRKVTATGTITTAAGNGTAAFSGDNGPAVSASLYRPSGVAVDSSMNLFIADTINNRIRRVSAGSIITTVAGRSAGGFSGEGGPATEASLSGPAGVTVDASGNLYIADSGNNRIRLVATGAPAVTVSPGQLSFALAAGDTSSAQIDVTSPVVGIAWTATVSSSSNWITISPASGTTPGVIGVAVNAASLQAGTYSASIMISNPVASPAFETVSVNLTVTAAAAGLSVTPSVMNFQIQQGSAAQSQTVTISSAGGGALDWTAQGDPAKPWVSISPSSGSVSVGVNSSLEVTANAAGLALGVHTATIRVSSATTGTSATVTINLLVTPAAPTIRLSQTGLTFTGIESGSVVPPQTFGVLNVGGGSMNWTATAVAGTGGSWLTVSPAAGASIANSASPPLVQLGAQVGSLIAGGYTAQIRIDAPGATNTPQFVNVVLNVLARGSALPPIVRPTGLIFVRQAGTSSPGSQTVSIATAKPETISAFPSVALLLDVVARVPVPSQVVVAPSNFSVSPSSPNQIIVQPNLGGLRPGQYSTTITIQFLDSTGPTNQTVSVLFVVTEGPTGRADFEGVHGAANGACTPQRLFVAARTLGAGFSSPVGYPQKIQALVIDDCNNPVTGATAIASFSSGDPPLVLAGLGDGIYEGSWFPGKASSQVSVTLTAVLGSLSAKTPPIPGLVTGKSLIGATYTHGASFAANGPLAPGSIISAFGQNLAASIAQASLLPVPTSLGGAQLNIGGRNVPLLYASPDQVNAQIPLDIAPNSSPSVFFTVTQGVSLAQTNPQTLTIARARAGIFVTNAESQGTITDAQGALLAGSNAATAGQVVVIYATGLGPVDRSVALGAPAPGDPPARITTPIQVTIGGQDATVQFAGLTPGFVGLYQVNVAIPQGVTQGPAVPVVIVQDGASSNTATIVVR